MATVIATLQLNQDPHGWGERALKNSRYRVPLEHEEETAPEQSSWPCFPPIPSDDNENGESLSQRSSVSRATAVRSDHGEQVVAIIHLNDILRSPTGVTFGTAKDCCFVFDVEAKLSQKHCSITISEKTESLSGTGDHAMAQRLSITASPIAREKSATGS